MIRALASLLFTLIASAALAAGQYPSPHNQTEILEAAPTFKACTGYAYGNAAAPLTCNPNVPATALGGLGTGVLSALQAATNTGGGIQTTALPGITPQAYGALGNSNGTHGNGADDTTAFWAAFDASKGKTFFVPCGIYRLTAGHTVTVLGTYDVEFQGECASLFYDGTPGTLLALNFATPCQYSQPCITVRGANLLPPNTISAANHFLDLQNVYAPVIDRINAMQWGVGVNLYASYAPTITNSMWVSMMGSVVLCNQDASCNELYFAKNGAFAGQAAVINAGKSTGGLCNTGGLEIAGNDIENNSTGLLFNGVCGVSITGNDFELNTNGDFTFGSVMSGAIDVRGNSFNEAAPVWGSGTPPNPTTIQNVTGITFGNNNFYIPNVAIGSSVSGLIWDGPNVTGGTSLTITGQSYTGSGPYTLTYTISTTGGVDARNYLGVGSTVNVLGETNGYGGRYVVSAVAAGSVSVTSPTAPSGGGSGSGTIVGWLPRQCKLADTCTNLPNGEMLQWGNLSATTTAAPVGYIWPCLNNATPFVSVADSSGQIPKITAPSLTGMSIGVVTGTANVNWQVICQ